MHLTCSTSTLSENLQLMLLASDEHQHSQMFQMVLVCKAWSSLPLLSTVKTLLELSQCSCLSQHVCLPVGFLIACLPVCSSVCLWLQ